MQTQGWMLPLSIVCAGALIGAGLYLGLRRAPAPSSPPVATSAYAPEPPEAGAPVVLAPPTAALRAKVAADVLAALDQDRARLVRTCWEPSFKKDPKPARLTLALRFEFNPKGARVVSGVAEADAPSRADVSECLRAQDLVPSVPAPGTIVAVEVRWSLP